MNIYIGALFTYSPTSWDKCPRDLDPVESAGDPFLVPFAVSSFPF